MVKFIKKYFIYIAITFVIIVISIVALSLTGEKTPEQQIKTRLTEFLSKASKSSGDKLSTGLLKSKSLENFFEQRCKFQVGTSLFSGTYTPTQISNNSMRYRTMVRRVKFSAHDIEIILTSPKTAKIDFTGAVNGVTKREKSFDDYKELTCKLRLVEGKWLIYSVSIREIMKK